MSDNLANPVKGAETDLQSAAKSISGLLNLSNEPKKEKQQQQSQEPELQVSSEPTQEESLQEDQPPVQENPEMESQEEVSETEVSQEEQTEIQQEHNSTYKVKVAGQELDVTLDELKSGYSRDADYRRKTEELSLQRQQFQSEAEKQRQDYSNKLNELNQLMSLAQNQLNAEIASADLERLYEEDPTEALRLERKLKQKQEKFAEAVNKTRAEQQKQLQEIVQIQQKELVNKLPEFSDPEKATQLKSQMRGYLNSYGFQDQEISQIYDHRIVMLVNDAMKYRNMQKLKPNLASKIAKPGKVLTSGMKKDKSDVAFEKRKEKLNRLRKSGHIKDATNVFLDILNNKTQR
jgi:hypothetical protein